MNKFKTLSQGTISESVLDKMAMTFQNLAKLADFETKSDKAEVSSRVEESEKVGEPLVRTPSTGESHRLGGLHYDIQIILPDSRDPKVYDALFRSLREHLIQ